MLCVNLLIGHPNLGTAGAACRSSVPNEKQDAADEGQIRQINFSCVHSVNYDEWALGLQSIFPCVEQYNNR
jgi:hypothetical protein